MKLIKAIFNALNPGTPNLMEAGGKPLSNVKHLFKVEPTPTEIHQVNRPNPRLSENFVDINGDEGDPQTVLVPVSEDFAIESDDLQKPGVSDAVNSLNGIIRGMPDEEMVYGIKQAYAMATKDKHVHEHGKMWYSTVRDVAHSMANRYLVDANGNPDPLGPMKVAGLFAAFSPRVSWGHNIKKVEMFLKKYVAGKRGSELSAPGLENANKAARDIINATSYVGIKHRLGGQKINAFFRNIMGERSKNPNRQPVTIDTHALAIAFGWKGLTPNGISISRQLYKRVANAYSQAAQELNIPVDELQAITWVARRNGLKAGSPSLSKEARTIESLYKKYVGENHPYIQLSQRHYTGPLFAHFEAFGKAIDALDDWVLESDSTRRAKLLYILNNPEYHLNRYFIGQIDKRMSETFQKSTIPNSIGGVTLSELDRQDLLEKLKTFTFFKAITETTTDPTDSQLIDSVPEESFDPQAYVQNLLSKQYALISPEKHDSQLYLDNDQPRLNQQDINNRNAHKEMILDLNKFAEKYGPDAFEVIPVEGSWGHIPENSYLVRKNQMNNTDFLDLLNRINKRSYLITNNEMPREDFIQMNHYLAKKSKQDSVIFGKGNDQILVEYGLEGKPKVTTGAGFQIFTQKPDTDYTKINTPRGPIYFTLNFDWR
jgi:hypothetical protein